MTAATIDTPAVLDDPDARIFGRISDSVALVLRASSTSVEDALAARDRFLSDRTPIAGAVLNDCERAAGATAKKAQREHRSRAVGGAEMAALPLSGRNGRVGA